MTLLLCLLDRVNSGVLLWWKSVINKLGCLHTDRFFVKASLRKPRCQAEQVFNEKCQAKARRGTGAWLEAVDGSIAKREHICVQDLLRLLPHIIRDMKQHQHRCTAEGYGSPFHTFRFIVWDARCATQKSSSGTLFDMKQLIKAMIQKRKYYTRDMLIVLKRNSLSAPKKPFRSSDAFSWCRLVNKAKHQKLTLR